VSAFVVQDQTINRVLAYLAATDHSRARRLVDEYAPEADKSLPGLGAAVRALNVRAVRQRYPDCPPDELPGPSPLLPYVYQPEHLVGLHQAAKSLRCLLYQLSEGDVPETPLYRALEGLSVAWLLDIADQVPAYDRAAWD
jgi:hypothetical protein